MKGKQTEKEIHFPNPQRFEKSLSFSFMNSCVQFMASNIVLPAGNRNNNGDFNNAGKNANFWSATENNENNAYNLNLNYNNDNANLNNNNKDNANSVRCLRDSDLFEQLYFAYKEARKNKRNTYNQLIFERDLEKNLHKLKLELQTRTYELSPTICFISEKPVKREIVAANFRDRVVHHLLCNWITPIFERQFIYDSYSCRKGKGTLFGIKRAKKFVMSESEKFTKECFVLRLDISGFFMGIDKTILYNQVMLGVKKAKWKGAQDKELAKFLIHKIVFQNPLENTHYKSPKNAWEDLPQNKSLKYAKAGCGLPIGNLTSQLFGNVYLNSLDHYIKRELKIRCYGRYVDDMVLIHEDKNELLKSIPKIRAFLKEKLKLDLHPKKISLQSVYKGFPFLGAYILPYRMYPSRRIVQNFKEDLKILPKSSKKRKEKEQSYKGLLSHFDAYKLFQKTINQYQSQGETL